MKILLSFNGKRKGSYHESSIEFDCRDQCAERLCDPGHYVFPFVSCTADRRMAWCVPLFCPVRFSSGAFFRKEGGRRHVYGPRILQKPDYPDLSFTAARPDPYDRFLRFFRACRDQSDPA